MIIVASPADGREAGGAIHADRGIAVANLEVDSPEAGVTGALDEIVEQELADSAPLLAGGDPDQQELGFVGNGPEQRKADHRVLRAVEREHQENARHWQDS